MDSIYFRFLFVYILGWVIFFFVGNFFNSYSLWVEVYYVFGLMDRIFLVLFLFSCRRFSFIFLGFVKNLVFKGFSGKILGGLFSFSFLFYFCFWYLEIF